MSLNFVASCLFILSIFLHLHIIIHVIQIRVCITTKYVTLIRSYKIDGDSIESTRTYGGVKSISNKGAFNAESDYNFLGSEMKVKISGKDGDVLMESVSGWASVTVKVDGNKMVETVKHNESGAVLVNTWARA